MNAELMIDEVLDIVDDPSFDREDDVLKYLNLGQVSAAAKLLIPGLSDGYDTVATLVDAYKAPAPADYMKMVHSVSVVGRPVRLCRNFADLVQRYEGLSLDAGEVGAVVISAGQVFYQLVPAVSVDIELFYYRLPTPMTDSLTSFPDGLGNLQDAMDNYSRALIHFAASQLYSKIEQGMEGEKVDTAYHFALYQALLDEFHLGHLEEIVHPSPPVSEVNW
jgi:hypothetical protein